MRASVALLRVGLLLVLAASLAHGDETSLARASQAGVDEVILACERGRLEDVQLMLRGNRELISAEYPGGFTPLHVAAAHGWRDLTRYLITAGFKINTRTLAAARLDDHEARKTVGEGTVEGVNWTLAKGATPLHLAAAQGQTDVVELLMVKGAELGARDEEDMTPLHMACSRARVEAAKALVARGARLEAKNQWGYTPLAEVAGMGMGHFVVYRQTAGGWSESTFWSKEAFETGHSLAGAAERFLAVARLLIAKGADINAKDARGGTVLANAVRMEFAGLIAELRRHGAKE